MDDNILAKKISIKEALKWKLGYKIIIYHNGFANFMNRQFIKGILFLLSQIIFIIAFIFQAISALIGLVTLGQEWKPTRLMELKFKLQLEGDNSMLLLIFGLASQFFALFLYIFIGAI